MPDARDIGDRYGDRIIGLIDAIRRDEAGPVDAAAARLADATEADRLIHVYGVGGHSYVGSEEFFSRAGGLANISPLFEPSLALAGGGAKSTMLERTPGIGDKIVKAHRLGRDDVLVITSAYGINAATIDAALEAKRRGCTVIAVTSVGFANATPPDFVARHPDRHNLHDLAHVTLDNHIPHGETVLDLTGFDQRVGGTCNVLQCFLINWLVARTIQLLIGRGIEPPVWRSYNVPGGDAHNQRLLERFTRRVKAL